IAAARAPLVQGGYLPCRRIAFGYRTQGSHLPAAFARARSEPGRLSLSGAEPRIPLWRAPASARKRHARIRLELGRRSHRRAGGPRTVDGAAVAAPTATAASRPGAVDAPAAAANPVHAEVRGGHALSAYR